MDTWGEHSASAWAGPTGFSILLGSMKLSTFWPVARSCQAEQLSHIRASLQDAPVPHATKKLTVSLLKALLTFLKKQFVSGLKGKQPLMTMALPIATAADLVFFLK